MTANGVVRIVERLKDKYGLFLQELWKEEAVRYPPLKEIGFHKMALKHMSLTIKNSKLIALLYFHKLSPTPPTMLSQGEKSVAKAKRCMQFFGLLFI